MYSLGDGAKNAKAAIFHIEGDPDHPVNRGALCPKGAGLVDVIHSESRRKFPEYRAPGSDKWQPISWEEAFDRIAKLMKEDRDANYIAQNAEGVTVNRWLSTGMLCASASSNETGYLTQKFSREAFDRIAKLMKEDRDANYIAQNAEGVTVNRWLSTGMLCASASSNETGDLTQKVSRALGLLAVDNQARV